MKKIAPSELVLNIDNSVYHLKLHPHQIAKDIIVVGDPGRVETISNYFDNVEHKVSNREILTHTMIDHFHILFLIDIILNIFS